MMSILNKPWQRWPMYMIYAPLLPKFLWLSVKYQVGIRGLSRVNPGLSYGGATITSKFERYSLFEDCDSIVPTIRVRPSNKADMKRLESWLDNNNISMPVVAKPDIGFMGQGVCKIDSFGNLVDFLYRQKVDYLVQPYIADRLEFAIYYYRLPSEPHGVILDVTERVLPHAIGDGQRTISELIDSRREWDSIALSLKDACRDNLNMIPKLGEEALLRVAANGGQGAVFIDSRDLCTPTLENFMDSITLSRGFFAGKFDIKIESREDLKAGSNIKILEVNGLTSELNYIYDPRHDYKEAYKAISAQIEIIFEIAHRNKSYPLPSSFDIIRKVYLLNKQLKSLSL